VALGILFFSRGNKFPATGSAGISPEEPIKTSAPAEGETSATVKGAAEGAAGAIGTENAQRPSGILYRGDGRLPETIFNEGFRARGTSSDLKAYVETNSPSAFVGTSKSQSIAIEFALEYDGYVYEIDPRNLPGIDVNSAHPSNIHATEQEIAMPGGVPRESIIGAKKVLPGGRLGPIILNPFYKAP
jgi:hypothetical protein